MSETTKKTQTIKLSTFMRGFNISLGTIYILIALIVFASIPFLAVDILSWILIAGLLFMGIERIGQAIFNEEPKTWRRIIRLILGLLFVLLAVIVFSIPDVGYNLLIVILAYAMIIQGISRIGLGLTTSNAPKRVKLTSAILGLITMVIAILILVVNPTPETSDETIKLLMSYLSFTFILNGVERILMGLMGVVIKQTTKEKQTEKPKK